MELLYGLAIVLGILSLIYYGIIIYYAGIQASFAWIWLLSGAGFLLFASIYKYMDKAGLLPGRLLQLLFLCAVAVGAGAFLLMLCIIFSYSGRKADRGMDYIIVLGAQVRGIRITKSLLRRLETALQYLVDNPKTRVIVSGGQGKGEFITEAKAMADYLLEAGIEEERILREDASGNTEENIRYSKALLRDESAKVAIITNGFHIYRALKLARKQGLKGVQGMAAPSDPLLSLNYYVREVFGVLKDLIYGNLS